jgi:hypothetical protein
MNLYSDLVIGIVAVLVLVRVACRPRPVHRTTAIVLTLVCGALLWANLRPTGWQAELGGVETPETLNPVTKAMFWRGWPLSPCMICLSHGMRFRPDGFEGCALVLDAVLFVVALLATKAICERCLRYLHVRNS